MRYIKFLIFLIVAFSYGGQDLENENIYIKSIDKSKEIEKEKEIQDKFYKENKSSMDSFIKGMKEKVKKDSMSPSNKYKDYKPSTKSKSSAKEIIKGIKNDKDMRRWIKNLTKDIYYKELYDSKGYKGSKKELEKVNRDIMENYLKILEGKSSIVGLIDKVLNSDERIYVFLSSSVPLSTWRNYIKSLRMINSGNIYIVLRGCIGKEGCKKIMPTVNYIRKVAFDSAGMDSSKPANVIIDPYLYRYYDVKVVPTIVYARGVSLIGTGSEGFEGNLKGKVNDYYKIEGDVSIFYFVSKLINELNLSSEGLKKINDIGKGL